MTHIAYIHGLTSSDRSAPEPVLDIAIIDIGEEATIAMMDVKIPTIGDRPLKQFVHSELLKLMTDDARSQAIDAGQIELRNGHTDADLKDALTKSSRVEDSLSENPRPTR